MKLSRLISSVREAERTRSKRSLRRQAWSLVFATIAQIVAPSLSPAAAPIAGSTIGNQASATYTDASNTPHTATSNVVLTVVQQVAGLTLSADQTKAGSPGAQVVFPHTITNGGNGADTFTFSVAQLTGDNFDLTNTAILADANGDGLPDSSTPITTSGLIAAGAKFQFVVVGTIPSSSTTSQVGQVSVTATSTFDVARTATNTDAVSVSSNAVVRVTLAVSPSGGPSPSGPYTYTLTFTNTGNATATNLVLADALPTALNYVAGSGRWSVSGSTALTDAAAGDPAGISYDYNITTPGSLTATVASLASGQSGTLTFQANIAANVPAGTVADMATFKYNDGSGMSSTFNTNTVLLNVTQPASVSLVGATVNSAEQGATVSFSNVVTNTGTSTETFEMTLSGSTFPAGTTFRLVRPDGVTALQDSNTVAGVDTGPLAAGQSFTVILRATLPPGATGGPYAVNKTATAASDPTIKATAADTLTAITTSTVDLTADAAATLGIGAGPEASAVVNQNGNPAETLHFVLNLKNTSTVADSYNFDVSQMADFSTVGLPTGWVVVYKNAAGTVVTKSDVLAAGANAVYTADVTIPAGQTPGAQQIYFRAQSPVTGASDKLHDSVTTNTLRKLTLTPNNTGQIFPTGSVVYSHTLTNAGNVLEGNNGVSTVSLATSNNLPGWTSVVYYDANGNGLLDNGEQPITDTSFVSNGAAGLSPGESIKILVKVFAVADATAGAVNPTTVVATTSNGTYTSSAAPAVSASDASTVVLSQLRLLKEQAIDVNGDGLPDTAYSTTNIVTGSTPGTCIRYRITVTNTGTENALSVVVNDVTPTFTTYHSSVGAATTVGSVGSTPANGATGSLSFNIGTLAPNASAIVTFGVQIDQ